MKVYALKKKQQPKKVLKFFSPINIQIDKINSRSFPEVGVKIVFSRSFLALAKHFKNPGVL